jgi:O-antigen/teichoic acid export membrane protein
LTERASAESVARVGSDRRALPGRVSRRLGWGIGDQALSSLTNFALGILAARSVSLREFGAFSLAFATYAVALGASRALATEPLLVRYSATEQNRWRHGAARASGTALSVGSAVGLGCVVLGFALGGSMRPALIAIGAMMPGLLLQDSWRSAFFAQGRGAQAFMNDLVWALVLFPTVGVLLARGTPSLAALILVWGGSGCVAAVFGIRQARVLPRPLETYGWLREQADLAPRFLGESVVIVGATQLWVFCIGALAGLATVGQIRAGQIVLGPLNVLFMGVGVIAIPEGVRLLAHSPSRLRRGAGWLSVGLAAHALAWGSVIFLLPSRVGFELLGSAWIPAHSLVVPLALVFVGAGIQKGADVGLRSLAAAKRSLRTRIVEACITVSGAVGGVVVGGAQGAAWGLAIAYLLEGALWWWQFSVELAAHGSKQLVQADGDGVRSLRAPS